MPMPGTYAYDREIVSQLIDYATDFPESHITTGLLSLPGVLEWIAGFVGMPPNFVLPGKN